MSMRRLALVIAITCAACGDDGKSPADGGPGDGHSGDGGGVGRTTVASIPATPNRDLDLLFVVDDSPSMTDKQNNLADNFPNFINVLNALPGGLPNLHLGVVTTDMGTSSSEDSQPGTTVGSVGQGGCAGTGKSGNLRIGGAPVTGMFISDIASGGVRQKNYTGNLVDAFSTMAKAGSGGCGFEQTLSAMKAALSPSNAANAGFIRPSALLGVVILTDEDDCSVRHTTIFGPDSPTIGPLSSFRCTRFGVTCTGGGTSSDEMNQVGAKTGCTSTTGAQAMTDIAPFHDFLVALKGDAQKVVVAAIMGTPEPFAVELRALGGSATPIPQLAHSCTYQGTTNLEVADPPVRIKQFLDMFPNRSTFATVCQADLSGPLAQVAQLVSIGIGMPCITQDLGTTPDCIVVDQVGTTETTLPKCGATPSPPCWHLTTDTTNCPFADHQKLVVERSQAPDPTTITELRCKL